MPLWSVRASAWYPRFAAVSASCSGSEAPSRNEKAEWQCSSTYIVKDVGEWGVVLDGACSSSASLDLAPDGTTPHSPLPTQLRFLHPPLARRQVLEQNHASTAIENHFNASPRDRLTPPFIVDAPDFTDSLNRATYPTSRILHTDRQPVRIELHLHPLRHIEGTESVSSIPHSALRIPH